MKKVFFSLIFFFEVILGFSQGSLINKTIIINDGNNFTNSHQLDLYIFCKNATSMQLSSTNDFSISKWIDYNTDYRWTIIDKTEGEKKVFVRFRNEEEISDPVSDNITLDTQPPQEIILQINSGNNITNNLEIELSITGKDIQFMMISNKESLYGELWQSYKPTIKWDMRKGVDGYRYVYAKFKDISQNESEIISARILLDREKPLNGDIIINNDNRYTNTKKVELTLLARECDSMIISLSNSFEQSSWEIFNSTKLIELEDPDGKKNVYAKFKDIANNESKIVYDSIIYDSTPPRNCSIIINNQDDTTKNINQKVTLKLHSEDADYMMISNTKDFIGSKWVIYKSIWTNWRLLGGEDGNRTVYVRYKDTTGNESEAYNDSIILKRGF